jgi:PucR family transcriptional regulator, purine catabolism regulatory protein
MALWLSDLLADPGLGAEVVAGHDGIDTRGPIRWAHTSELQDPTPWLEGGELLLTTGLGVRDDPQAQRRLVLALAERGVVALGFGIGVTLDEVPEAMVRACDDVDLPLFTVPYEIPFIAVSRRVAHHAFAQQFATLQRAVDLHRQVLGAVVAESGVAGVLATVAPTMPDATLIVFDFAGTELARVDPADRTEVPGSSAIWNAIRHAGPRARVALDCYSVHSASVTLRDHVEAIVVAVTAEPLVEHEQLLFEQGLAGVSLELARNRSVREAQRARVDELLEDVASGRTTRGMIERRLTRLDATALDAYRVLAVVRGAGGDDGALCSVVEDAVVPFGPPVVGRLDGSIRAVVPADAAAAEAILAAATHRGWPDVRIGRSRAKSDPDALRAALREAQVALRLDGPTAVQDVEELGLSGLVAGIRDDLGAEDFVSRVLGPVIDHDHSESGRLVETLRAYLAHGCRPGPAAQELCIHRHTLTYRLERIRELTGRDPRAGANLVEFGLALELLDHRTT